MDVKSAFLNGYIDELVYVAQPPGLKIQSILTMFIGCSIHFMDSSKPQGLDMRDLGTSYKRWDSRLGEFTPYSSLRPLEMIYSYAISMLMILSLTPLTM